MMRLLVEKCMKCNPPDAANGGNHQKHEDDGLVESGQNAPSDQRIEGDGDAFSLSEEVGEGEKNEYAQV